MTQRAAAPLAWTDEQLGTFWDYYARHRQEDYFTGLFGDRILDLTRRYYAPGALLCDYGCGSGFLLEKLLRAHRAAGCDFSEGNLQAVRERLGGHPNFAGVFRIGEPPAATQYDALYVVETVEHVLERHEAQFFGNLTALLRPGGIVVVTTPNAEDLAAETVFCPQCSHAFHRWQHVRSFDGAALTDFFGRRGFQAVATFTTDFAARGPWRRLKAQLRPVLGRRNPHLVYVGRKAG
jgi:2-polyprenyl-3-methyl-5-hydroxy-6-metoxy-1,4-benzoquinol methylase